jgi:hypothetical protein
MRQIFRQLFKISGGLALFFTLTGLTLAAAGQNLDSGGLPARTYVTVRSKAASAPAVAPADVRVKESGKPVQVTGWSPVLSDGRGIELAFVIDDSLRGNVGVQLNDIKAFFQTLPPGISVFVGYMQNGHVTPATQGFTTDRTAAIQALRVPMGIPGGNASPYFCISDLVKSWPSRRNGNARVIFTVTNGVDNYTGANPLNTDSPYVEDAIRDAQRADVLVYSLYYPDQGVGAGASTSGQNYLSMMAEQTGGTTYYEGSFTPVSFAPFLKQFDGDLNRLFELKFLSPKSGLQPLKLSTDVKGVKLTAPEQVFVGEPE